MPSNFPILWITRSQMKQKGGLSIYVSQDQESSLWRVCNVAANVGTTKHIESVQEIYLHVSHALIEGLHGDHVGWQEQYIFSPLGNKMYFHARIFHCSCHPTWPPCKPPIGVILHASRLGCYLEHVLLGLFRNKNSWNDHNNSSFSGLSWCHYEGFTATLEWE